MYVISLQEPSLGPVYVPRIETVNPALIGGLFTPKLLIYAYQVLQILSFNVYIDVYEASFELSLFKGLD